MDFLFFVMYSHFAKLIIKVGFSYFDERIISEDPRISQSFPYNISFKAIPPAKSFNLYIYHKERNGCTGTCTHVPGGEEVEIRKVGRTTGKARFSYFTELGKSHHVTKTMA